MEVGSAAPALSSSVLEAWYELEHTGRLCKVLCADSMCCAHNQPTGPGWGTSCDLTGRMAVTGRRCRRCQRHTPQHEVRLDGRGKAVQAALRGSMQVIKQPRQTSAASQVWHGCPKCKLPRQEPEAQ